MAEFASRSPLHGLVVWLVKTLLILAISAIAYLVVMNVIVPAYVEEMIQQVTN